MATILLCDDNTLHLNQLKELIEELTIDENYAIESYTSGSAILKRITESQWKEEFLIFMDIRLQGQKNGIYIAQDIHRNYGNVPIIFITGYLEYAADVGEADPIYFVSKPIRKDNLRKALHKAKEKMACSKISFHLRGKEILLPKKEILYIERNLRTSKVYALNQTLEISEKLNQIFLRLSEKNFIRCHVSYLVNLEFVSAVTSKTFTLSYKNYCKIEDHDSSLTKSSSFQSIEIPISRSYYTKSLEAYTDFLGQY